MWVSGSLISSSTWRSSSVSAPSMLQLDLLAELVREVAHDARQLGPGIADRLHARLHHAFLQVGGDVRQALQRRAELAVLLRCAAICSSWLRVSTSSLTSVIRSSSTIDVDADGLGGDRRILASLAFLAVLRRLVRGDHGRRAPLTSSTARCASTGGAPAPRRHGPEPPRPPPAPRPRSSTATGSALRGFASRRASPPSAPAPGAVGERVQPRDQIGVVARRLGLGRLEGATDRLDRRRATPGSG